MNAPEPSRPASRAPVRARAGRVALAAATALVLAVAGAVAMGGELQDLHTEQTVVRAAEESRSPARSGSVGESAPDSAAAPPGTAFLPGFGPSGGSGERPGAAIERIGLERTRCLVGCPAFTLIVERDGSFRWQGEYGVERLGSHRGRIEPGRVLQVMDVVADLGIADLDATYASPFLDNATSYVLVENEAGAHVIEDQAGAAPPRLWAVGQLIEGLLDYAEWDEPAGTRE